GLDLASRVDAPINYMSYDGKRIPANDGSFDTVLLCYVLPYAGHQRCFERGQPRPAKGRGRHSLRGHSANMVGPHSAVGTQPQMGKTHWPVHFQERAGMAFGICGVWV